MRIQDINADQFIEQYALRCTSKRSLQFGLLLVTGASLEEAGNLACFGEQAFINNCTKELEKMGFIERHGTG